MEVTHYCALRKGTPAGQLVFRCQHVVFWELTKYVEMPVAPVETIRLQEAPRPPLNHQHICATTDMGSLRQLVHRNMPLSNTERDNRVRHDNDKRWASDV